MTRCVTSFPFCFCFAFLLFFCSACQHHTSSPADAVFWQGTDSYGRDIVLERPPQRIVSLSPCLTEIIFLLHQEQKLVGISDFCQYPPEGTARIRKVGGLTNCNAEALAALRPDVILIGSLVPRETVERLERAGIPVVAIRAEESLDDLDDAVNVTGAIVGEPAAAQTLAAHFRDTLGRLRETCAAAGTGEKPSVYYVVGYGAGGDFTAPATSHIHDIITLAGGRNVGEKLTTWSINREWLFHENPDIILIRSEDSAAFVSTPPYDRLAAVKNGNVFPMASNAIDIVTPRNIETIQKIHSLLQKIN